MRIEIAGIALAALGVASVAGAQTVVRANVPFAFEACGTVHASGTYTISQPSQASAAFVIRSTDVHERPCLLPARYELHPETAAASKLVFHRYGTAYFLREVWAAGNSSGWSFPASPLEREMAAKFSAPASTTLAALPR